MSSAGTSETQTTENEVPLEEWLAGDSPYILPDESNHHMHCSYVWGKLHRAYLNKWPLDGQAAGLAHTKHRSMLQLEPVFDNKSLCGDPKGCIFYARTTWTSCSYH